MLYFNTLVSRGQTTVLLQGLCIIAFSISSKHPDINIGSGVVSIAKSVIDTSEMPVGVIDS